MTPPGLSGYSRALYSNWFWHQPLQLLIDAGEGLSLALGTHIFSLSVIAITHGHSDHVLGLPGIVGARRFGKGAIRKPYTVVYPHGSPGVEAIRQAIGAMWRGVDFPIAWSPVTAGDEQQLGAKTRLQAFAVTHVAGEVCLGYRVIESRRRLRAEFAGLPQPEIERLARQHGRDRMTEDHAHVVFAHSGDAMPVDLDAIRGADVLVHDATFLEAADRREPIHACAREVFALAHDAEVRTLILNHLSIRYDRTDAVRRLRQQLLESGFAGDCWLLDESALVNLR
jgi:ribonuclease Z